MLIGLLALASCTAVSKAYWRQMAIDYSAMWCSPYNINYTEYCCAYYSDACDLGWSFYVPENANFLSQIMQYGGMGWCETWVHGNEGETLDPIFTDQVQNPIQCEDCGQHTTLMTINSVQRLFWESERWTRCPGDDANPTLFRIPADIYHETNVAVCAGSVIEFDNAEFVEQFYVFVATCETYDGNGQRQFDAVLRSHAPYSCNGTLADVYLYSLGEEDEWSNWLVSVYDPDGCPAMDFSTLSPRSVSTHNGSEREAK